MQKNTQLPILNSFCAPIFFKLRNYFCSLSYFLSFICFFANSFYQILKNLIGLCFQSLN